MVTLGGTVVDFSGEEYAVAEGETLLLGREGDVVIDDNPFLHRRFLEVAVEDGLTWLTNIGSKLSVTVTDEQGLAQTRLAPGARIPLVFERTVVWFTAGPTTYEFDVINHRPHLRPAVDQVVEPDGETTLGRVALTHEQMLLILALAEEVLRRGPGGTGSIPASRTAAERLGWTTTKFNRKLDYLCETLAKHGVRGLHGGAGNNASNRRARLVEYALATRVVTVADLDHLDRLGPGASDVAE